jgi:glycerol-3-phosphate acyltransferase PlsY
LALLLDLLKGLLPTLAARLLLAGSPHHGLLIGVTMIAAVAGHMFTVFLLFRGGKGVATALGCFWVICPIAALVGMVLYVGLYAWLRISSLGSLSLTAAVPITMWLLGVAQPQLFATLVVCALIIIKHIPNIRRLLSGQEGKV